MTDTIKPAAYAVTDHGNVVYLNDDAEDTAQELSNYGGRSGMELVPLFTQAAIDAAVAQERERCVRLADEYATWGGSNFALWFHKLAAAIRAGEPS